MKTAAFFLEEQSAREMLEGILPRILPPDIHPAFLVFRGKQHLEKNLAKRLSGWMLPDSLFVVMRDQDSGDCREIKEKLTDLCRDAGKGDALVRVACTELESFYLGDLQAVEKGLGVTGIAKFQNSRKYRNPDMLGNPSQELRRLTKHKYRKVSGSRLISHHLRIDGNKSPSFNALVSGIRTLLPAWRRPR